MNLKMFVIIVIVRNQRNFQKHFFVYRYQFWEPSKNLRATIAKRQLFLVENRKYSVDFVWLLAWPKKKTVHQFFACRIEFWDQTSKKMLKSMHPEEKRRIQEQAREVNIKFIRTKNSTFHCLHVGGVWKECCLKEGSSGKTCDKKRETKHSTKTADTSRFFANYYNPPCLQWAHSMNVQNDLRHVNHARYQKKYTQTKRSETTYKLYSFTIFYIKNKQSGDRQNNKSVVSQLVGRRCWVWVMWWW